MIILMIVFYCFTNLFFKCLIVTQQVDFTPHDLVGTHSAKKKKNWSGEMPLTHFVYVNYFEILIYEICFCIVLFSLSFMQAFHKSLPKRMNRKQK